MGQQNRQARVLETLIGSLASARGGSRELDIVVSFVLGDKSSESGQMIHLLVEEGYPWNIISELLDQEVPAYTTSLDAAIPGENVVLTMFSPRRSKWAAVQKSAGKSTTMAWAATECLARRRAALMALNGGIRARAAGVPGPGVRAAGNQPAANSPNRGAAMPPDHGPGPKPPRPPRPPRSTEAAARATEAEAEEEEWKILF